MIQEDSLEYSKTTGEILYSKSEKQRYPKKYGVYGKMSYIGHMSSLIELLSKKELLLVLSWFSNETNEYNLLNKKFKDLTSEMDKASRSRFKKKLLTHMIIQEHRGRIMLNPLIFKPTTTKYNGVYRTQGLWKYLFEDKDSGSEEIRFHEDDVFGLPDILKLK